MITIRPFQPTDEDYTRAVDIFNAVWVGQEETVEEWKEGDKKRSKILKYGRSLRRWMAKRSAMPATSSIGP